MPLTCEHAIYHHANIFKAIERHDQIAAKKHMQAHIKSLIRWINKSRESQLMALRHNIENLS
jgi:DNA-binding GntR family transcriptional regulator